MLEPGSQNNIACVFDLNGSLTKNEASAAEFRFDSPTSECYNGYSGKAGKKGTLALNTNAHEAALVTKLKLQAGKCKITFSSMAFAFEGASLPGGSNFTQTYPSPERETPAKQSKTCTGTWQVLAYLDGLQPDEPFLETYLTYVED